MDRELEQEALHHFEKASLAIDQAKNALREAKESLETFVPARLYQALLPAVKEIEGLAQGLFPSAAVEPTVPGPYREGILCSIDGVAYWHTGRQYGVAVGSPDGPDQDLRELPGFKRIAERFDEYSSLLFGHEWREAGDANPGVAAAIEVLRSCREQLWWESVVDFLRAYKAQRVDREMARQVLLKAGFDAKKITDLLPD